ncbi:hypothetical protein IAU59_002091 [Kwoniella sp. CBS 9459]
MTRLFSGMSFWVIGQPDEVETTKVTLKNHGGVIAPGSIMAKYIIFLRPPVDDDRLHQEIFHELKKIEERRRDMAQIWFCVEVSWIRASLAEGSIVPTKDYEVGIHNIYDEAFWVRHRTALTESVERYPTSALPSQASRAVHTIFVDDEYGFPAIKAEPSNRHRTAHQPTSVLLGTVHAPKEESYTSLKATRPQTPLSRRVTPLAYFNYQEEYDPLGLSDDDDDEDVQIIGSNVSIPRSHPHPTQITVKGEEDKVKQEQNPSKIQDDQSPKPLSQIEAGPKAQAEASVDTMPTTAADTEAIPRKKKKSVKNVTLTELLPADEAKYYQMIGELRSTLALGLPAGGLNAFLRNKGMRRIYSKYRPLVQRDVSELSEVRGIKRIDK